MKNWEFVFEGENRTYLNTRRGGAPRRAVCLHVFCASTVINGRAASSDDVWDLFLVGHLDINLLIISTRIPLKGVDGIFNKLILI